MKTKLLEELSKYDKKIKNPNLYIWGVGNTLSLYREGLLRLEDEGIIIQGYVDGNPQKWGTDIYGKKVMSPDELFKLEHILVLITSPQPNVFQEVSALLDERGVDYLHIDYFIFATHNNEICEAIDSLSDDESKRVYINLLNCRMRGEYPSEEVMEKGIPYFSFGHFSEINKNEVFVDCGAYVGDSIERYIWSRSGMFKFLYAFEPDQMNIKALNYRMERLKREWNIADEKVNIINAAISNKRSRAYWESYGESNGLGSKVVESGNHEDEILTVTIDETIKEKYSFLKADIESFEYKCLLGAEKSIRANKPKLAICIYHNAVDFYSVLLLLKSFRNDYKFSIRHYSLSTEDTILYAY